MRVGVVLGAGGVLGASWLIGALEALEQETGWRASDAEVVVGTSAGSVIGTSVASGLPPSYLSDFVAGQPLPQLDELEALELEAADFEDREAGVRYRLHRGLPALGPGSWRMALATLRHPLAHSPTAVFSGWVPQGMISTEPISQLVDTFTGDAWPRRTELWIVACDYRTGRRVVFGREGSPYAAARDAVAASCAIPGFYRPVEIGGRCYVDGGVCSPSNADVLASQGLDAVVVLNPMSSLAPAGSRSPVDRLGAALRAASGRRLGRELQKLRTAGTEVLCLQPGPEDVALMGVNLMARRRRVEVLALARETTAAALREQAGDLPVTEVLRAAA